MAGAGLNPMLRSAIFLMADNFVAWTLYGILCVQLIRYAAAIRSYPGRESTFQMSSVAVLFALRTAQTAVSFSRIIRVYVDHFTDPVWVTDYRYNPHMPAGFFIGLCTISLVQCLFLLRALAFAKHLYPPGSMDWFRRSAIWGGGVLFWTCFTSGLTSEILRITRYDTVSELRAAIMAEGTPAFLVLEVVWLASALVLMVVFSAASARDHLYAHRYNQESRLPATDQTTAIISEMIRVGATNVFLIVLSTSIYIFLILYFKATIAGRGSAALPAVYVCSLLVHIMQPRALRERQILEAAVSSAESSGPDSSPSDKKRLFGFISKRRRMARSSGGNEHRLSLSRSTRGPGFFSLLVRNGPAALGPPVPYTARRRPSVDGVQKTIEVVSYSERLDGEDRASGLGPTSSSVEGWEARNIRLGIGNSVWVENRRSRRPLSVNDHSLTTRTDVSLASHAEDRLSNAIASQNVSFVRASPTRPTSRAQPVASPVLQSFITSFPAGAVESQRHATYDPDLDLVDLPILGETALAEDGASAILSPSRSKRAPPPASPHVHYWSV